MQLLTLYVLYIYTYNNNNTAILNHLRQSECNGDINDFEITGRAKNYFFLRIKGSLLIKKFKPDLNNKVISIPYLRSCRYMRFSYLSLIIFVLVFLNVWFKFFCFYRCISM